MKIMLTINLAIILLLVGCSSINWQDKAVQKARSKAIEKLNLLSNADRFEIKFGQPKLYQYRIFNRSENPHISKNDVCHTWIVWFLPDSKGKCVVVSGVSEARMDDWNPERVVLRNLSDLQFDKEKFPENKNE